MDFGRLHGWVLLSECEVMSRILACVRSKEPALDLVAVNCPAGVGLFLATVKLKVRARADTLDQFPKGKRLAAMNRAPGHKPASASVVAERQMSTNAQQQVLVGDTPVVAHADLRLNPHEA